MNLIFVLQVNYIIFLNKKIIYLKILKILFNPLPGNTPKITHIVGLSLSSFNIYLSKELKNS